MSKHTKLFYRTIARMKAVGEKNGMVYLSRIKTKMGTDYVRAARLNDELIEAGILIRIDLDFINKTKNKYMGNIIWENLSKFRVPRKITEIEKARVEEERKRGQLNN